MPDLSFRVEGATVVPFAAVPMIAFQLRIKNAHPDETIHTIALRCQIQIEVTRRRYSPGEQERLLDLFWRNVDPLTPDAQFCDHGSQYRSAIFYSSETQKRLADASKAALDASHRFNRPIVTEITPAAKFWPAEEYHQHYHVKNPLRYRYYRFGCGRDRRLEELWGAPPPSL